MDTNIADLLPGVLSAMVGAGGAGWVARNLLSRMVSQYDGIHENQAKRLEALTAQVNDALTRLAVVEMTLHDLRQMRLESERRFGKLQGETCQALRAITDDISQLNTDINVAHERLRCIASGDFVVERLKGVRFGERK